MNRWVWIILIIALTTISTLLIRRLSIGFSWGLLFLIGVISLTGFFAYYQLFKSGAVGATYALITGSVIILVALGAKYFYREIWSIWTILGLVLIVLGIFSLGFLDKRKVQTKN